MNNEESHVAKKIQDGLKKLISEEFYAYQLYAFSRMAVRKDDRAFMNDAFAEIGDDELNDHLAQLVEWCRANDCDVPCSDGEFRKYASSKISDQLKRLKKGEDALYYIEEAIKSEEEAIKSYRKALDIEGVCQYTDLQSLLWHIYYDEEEHLSKLTTLRIACEADVDLVM